MKISAWPCGCSFSCSMFDNRIYSVYVCPTHVKEPEIQGTLILLVGKLGQLIKTQAKVDIAGCAPG